MTELEQLLLLEIEAAELPAPKRQYKFHSSRRWLADFCWPESRLIVEVNGMTHVAGTRAYQLRRNTPRLREGQRSAGDGVQVLPV